MTVCVGKGKDQVFRMYIVKTCVEVDDDGDDAIYVLQLGIQPVAVVGSLVQKWERQHKRRNNTKKQYKNTEYKTKTNTKRILRSISRVIRK